MQKGGWMIEGGGGRRPSPVEFPFAGRIVRAAGKNLIMACLPPRPRFFSFRADTVKDENAADIRVWKLSNVFDTQRADRSRRREIFVRLTRGRRLVSIYTKRNNPPSSDFSRALVRKNNLRSLPSPLGDLYA